MSLHMEHPSVNFTVSFFHFPCHFVWLSISPHNWSTDMFLPNTNKVTGDSLMFPQWWSSKSNFLGYCITGLIRTNGISLFKTQNPLLKKLATPLQHPRKVSEMKKYTFLNIQFFLGLTSAANNPASSRVTFLRTSICKWPSSDIVMRFPSAFTSSPFFVLQAKYYTQHKLRSTIK